MTTSPKRNQQERKENGRSAAANDKARFPLTLEERSALLSAVFARSPEGMAFLDPSLVIRAANESFARQMHVPLDQMLGRKGEDVTRGLMEQIGPIFREVRETGKPFKGEAYQFFFKDQPERGITYWDASVSPIYASEHILLGFLVLLHEVTERKRAEEERDQLMAKLRDVNQQLVRVNIQVKDQAEMAQRRANELETIIESIADAVFVCDQEGRVIDLNRSAMRILGLTRKENITGFLSDYVRPLNLRHPDGRPFKIEELALQRALRGEVVRDYEEIARDLWSNRDIDLILSASPVRDREGNIVAAVVVVSDITRIRELDRLKDEFIAVAAHELKTPVAVMKGYAQALLRAGEEISPPRRKMLDAINRGADRIDRIVKDLLDISRLHVGHLELAEERIDLTELVEEVVDRMALTTSKHRVRVVRAEPVVIRGDRDRLEQVLVNLLDNAIKYSPKGGNIDVEVVVRGREAVVSVRDYGVGIPKEKQAGIFQRFYRAHAGTPYDYGGMGVGLYISREIVSRHGGRMWFDSEEGKGSTFYLALPLA